MQLQGFKTVILLFPAMVFSLGCARSVRIFLCHPPAVFRAVGEVLVMKLLTLGRTAQAERYRTCLIRAYKAFGIIDVSDLQKSRKSR